MLAVAVFAPDFNRKPNAAMRRAYVADELRRLQASGPLSLAALLAGAVDGAASVALDLIDKGRGPDGADVVPPGFAVSLRLREGAVPPVRDPQGRQLPADKQGKVLVVKVGQRSQLATERATDANARRDIYETTEVTATARAYRLREAVTILRQWGVGVADDLDRHLVEEVLDSGAKGGKR
jgi:hypothetical protein